MYGESDAFCAFVVVTVITKINADSMNLMLCIINQIVSKE